MSELSGDAARATALDKPFSSMAALWRAHLDLRYALSNAERGAAEAPRTASDIRAFIVQARATGAILADKNERQTAQGILDYWSTELLSLPGTAAEDFTPALLEPFDSSQIPPAAGEPTQPEKLPEAEARELIRFVATARLWRDSDRQPGYLLNDEDSIAQAARFKHQDPDIFELVAESEIALSKKRTTRRFLAIVGILGRVIIGMLGVTLLQELRLREADRKAAAQELRTREAELSAATSIGAVERILKVLSKQTSDRAIPIAAAAELFKGAESILSSGDEQPDGKRPEVIGAHAKLLIQFSDVYLDAGDSRRALALAEQAEKLAGQLTGQDPGNDAWQSLVYKTAFRIGDIVVNYDIGAAKVKYDLALKVAETFADKDPSNVDRQADVALVMNKEGDLDLMKGNWDSALSRYQKSLDIGKALKGGEPQQNPAARKIVGDAWARLGGLSAAQGRYDEALEQYQEAFNIRKSLAEEHPEEGVYQGNLAAAYHFMGGVYRNYYDATNNGDMLDKALQQYGVALKIRQARANADSGNASWQDSLQQEELAIADALLRKQDLAGAIEKYRTALDIRQALVVKDPSNAAWKANLASTHDRLANALTQDQQFDSGLKEYDAALEQRKDLAARFPDDRGRQSQLATAYEHKGDALAARGKAQKSQSDLRDAGDAYQAGLTVVEAFLRKDPGSRLEPARDRLRKKMDALASAVQ